MWDKKRNKGVRSRNDLFTACKLKVIAAEARCPRARERVRKSRAERERTPFAAANENERAFFRR